MQTSGVLKLARQDRAEPAGVVDREGAALEVFEAQLVRPGPRGQVLDGTVEAVDRQLVGVVDYRHDQTVLHGDGDADVDAALSEQAPSV